MIETLNFTQFCVKNGYVSDYDRLDHGMLSPSGHCSNRQHQANLKAHNDRFTSNAKGHQAFIDAILNDQILDADGLTKASILNSIKQTQIKDIQSKIANNQTQINFILSLGRMAYTSTGKIKISYQRAIDDHQSQINKLQNEYNILMSK